MEFNRVEELKFRVNVEVVWTTYSASVTTPGVATRVVCGMRVTRVMCVRVCVCVCKVTKTMCVCVCVYVYGLCARERERERESVWATHSASVTTPGVRLPGSG